jgi:GNAT superfamily N-acetyltransferase
MIDTLINYKKNFILKKLELQIKRLEKSDFNFTFSIKETKHGEPVLLYWSEDVGVRIIHLQCIFKGKPTHSKINLITRGDTMVIADIQVLEKRLFNRGYGSILLESALQFAEESKIKFIKGDLMTESEAHFQRQKHFYEKHGFKIIDDSKIYQAL